MRVKSLKTTIDNQLPLLPPPPLARAALTTCGRPIANRKSNPPALFGWYGLCLAVFFMPGALHALTIAPLTREHLANNPADSSGSISVLPAAGEEQWTAAVVAAKAGGDVSWVTILPVPPSFLAYSLSENFNAEDRTALIQFSPSATFTLVQRGRGAQLTPTALSFGAPGGTATVDIIVLPGTKWRYENNISWITLTSPMNNLNSATRTLTVAPNPALDPRTGLLVIAGQTLTIRQSGEDVLLSTNQLTVPYYFNLTSVAVSAASSTAWRPVSNMPWITFGSPASIQGPGQFSCLIAPNDAFTERTGKVTVGSKTVTIRQIGNQRPLMQIDPTHSTAAAAGASGNFNVAVSPGTPWSVVSQSPWLRVDNSGTRTGSGTAGVTALPNNTTQMRVGYLTVVRATPSLPAGLDPLLAFPKSLPVLAHLTNPDSGVDEVLQKVAWAQVVTLGPVNNYFVVGTGTWESAFNNARSESSDRITMLCPTYTGEAIGWINLVEPDDKRWTHVAPGLYGNGLPLVNAGGGEEPWLRSDEFRITLSGVKTATTVRMSNNYGAWHSRTDTLKGYYIWAWERTNLDQRMLRTSGLNRANGVCMVVLADPRRNHVFGVGETEIVVPGNPNSPAAAQRLLVASVATSGAVTVFADGNPVRTGFTTNSAGNLRTSFYAGYRCTVYGNEIGQQTASELADSLNPTRIYEVRQDGFQPSVAPQQVQIGPAGGTVELTVTIAPGVNWTAHTLAGWVLLDGVTDINRLSSGTVSVSILPNDSTEPRTADLIFAEEAVTVSQQGRDVNLTALSAGFSKTDSVLHGTVSPQGGVVMFGIEPENGAQWIIHADAQSQSWANPTLTFGTGTKTVMIAIAPYSTSVSSRAAVFQIGSQVLIVTQRGFEAVLDPSQQIVGTNGGVFEARLSVPSSVLWNAVSLTPWISVTTAQQTSGSGSFFYRVDSGTGTERFGYISVGGELFKVVQSSSAGPQEIVLRLERGSGNDLAMELLAPSAASIVIEESSNCVTWLPLQSVVGKGPEAVRVILPYDATSRSRFYRARK